MKRILLAMIIVVPFLLMQQISSEPSRYEGKIVRKIDYVGLRNFSKGDIEEIISTTVNYPLKASEVREDIRKIFDKGFFDRVDVDVQEYQDGVQLRFIMKERPVIHDIDFRGNNEVSEQDLKTTVIVKEGDIYRKDFVEKSVRLIKNKYDKEGLFNSVVTYNIRERSRGGEVDIDFIIDEGEEIKVSKIVILGAKSIHPRELRSIMDTTEDGLFKDGTFQESVYEQDKAKIIAYYKQNGYLDAQIVEDKVEYEWLNPQKKERRGIFITLKLFEGEKYYFDGCTLAITGDKEKTVFTSKELMNEIDLKEPGEVFNFTTFMKDRQNIAFKYATQGYIFARVIPKQTINEREVTEDGSKVTRKFVKIDYVVEEGSQAYVDMIIVKGNRKTKEKVIRRELLIKEGELFDSRKMQLSRERVYNLGFFKEVNIDVRPGSREGYMNLVVDVEEQPTGTISLGGGYGTTSGFSIFADVSENNLLGNGQKVGVKFEYGPLRSSVTVSFTERWLMNYPVSFNAAVFYYLYTIETTSIFSTYTDEEATYKKQSFGYSLGLSYRFWNYYAIGMTWTQAFKKILDPTGDSSDEVFRAVALGREESRTIGFYIAHDSRDNYLNPTRGLQMELLVEFTGGILLGGDDHYIRYTPEFDLFFSFFHLPFLRSHPVVFEVRGNATFMTPPWWRATVTRNHNYLRNEWLPQENRLVMGGPETLRGWDYLDSDFPFSWRYIGLFHRILYGVEIRVPLHPQMLWMAFFFDAGALFNDRYWMRQLSTEYQEYLLTDMTNRDLMFLDQMWGRRNRLMSYFRYSYGFGFRIQIPMMPLRFWFGRKLEYDGGFKSIGGFNFQFAIGDMRY
ncbi:MAG: outer membrane protein assembly factor BamA [Spirochaetes bacterium]|nr:outer membrane protein assembly factor BamA [Spirochaetota bacterium]